MEDAVVHGVSRVVEDQHRKQDAAAEAFRSAALEPCAGDREKRENKGGQSKAHTLPHPVWREASSRLRYRHEAIERLGLRLFAVDDVPALLPQPEQVVVRADYVAAR